MGSQSKAVAQLQQKLRQLGYLTGAVDGLYGAQTRSAVMTFQRTSGLAVDGIVGAKTWATLEKLAVAGKAVAGTIASESSPAPVSSPQKTPKADERIAQEISPPQWAARSNSDFLTPGAYPWLLGWTILYLGGWLLIIKNALRQQRSYGMLASLKSPQRGTNSSAIAELSAPIEQPEAINIEEFELAISELESEELLLFEDASPGPTVQELVQWLSEVEDAAADRFRFSDAIAESLPSTSVSMSIKADEVLEVLPADDEESLLLSNLAVNLHPSPPPKRNRKLPVKAF